MASQKPRISAGLISLTMLSVALEILFFIPVITSGHQVFVIQGSSELLIPTNWVLLIGLIVLPIIYCSIFSVALKPKSIVNPIWVSAGTLATVIILTVVNISYGSIPLGTQAIAAIGLLAFLSGAFLFLIGFFQWIAVRWVIRMNYVDCDRQSYFIDMKPKELLHKLGSSFLDDWLFSRECDIPNIWVLKRSDPQDRIVLLEIGSDPKEEGRSIIATVAYEADNYCIVRSSSASRIRDIIIDDIEKRADKKTRVTLSFDDPVSALAYSNVESLSRSRIEVTLAFLKKLPKEFKAMLGLTLFLLVGFSLVYFNYPQMGLNADTFADVMVVIFVALFIEIGLPLRDEIQKRKREEIEL